MFEDIVFGRVVWSHLLLTSSRDSRALVAALISSSIDEQIEGKLQADLVRRLAPKIADLPYSPVPWKRRLKRQFRFLKPSFLRNNGPKTYEKLAAL